MKQFIAIISITALLLCCKTPTKNKEYNFPQLGWTISVPDDLTVMDSSQIKSINANGKNAIEKTLDTAVDFSETKTLISLQQDKLNTFTVTTTPFDPKKDGDWLEQNETVKTIMVQTFKTQAPGVVLDTSSSIELINGLDFRVFKTFITYPNKMLLKTFLYSKLYKGYDFGITITYIDEKTGSKLRDILSTSSFRR